MEATGRKYLLMKAVDGGRSPLSGFVRIQRDRQGKTVLYLQIKKRLIQESGSHVYEVCLYQKDARPQWVPIAVIRMDGVSEAKEERDVTGYPGAENMALMLYVFRRGENKPVMMAIENESIEEEARQVTRYAEPRNIEEKRENRETQNVIQLPAGATAAKEEKAPAIAGFAEPAAPEAAPEKPAAAAPEAGTAQETGGQPKTYWERTREFYLGLFAQGQSCEPFEDMFPDTEWVVVQPRQRDPYYGAFDHYLIGLTRRDKKVVTILYAVPGGMYWMPPAPGYGFSRFIPVDPSTGMGYWLCFLDAETGKASW